MTAEDAEPRRLASLTWANTIRPLPVVWAWRDEDMGRIPAGSLSVAAGREGTGKSSFGIWLAAQITRGTLPGSLQGQPRPVFYVAVEDSWVYTLVPRLIAAGADLAKVARFDVLSETGGDVTLSLPRDLGLLEGSIREHGAGLVVIDPLMSTMGQGLDTHREHDVRQALDPLARMADRTGAVVLGIAHFNKGASTDAASLITGSGAFKNVPRSVFGFARDDADEDGGRIMSQVKNSLGRDDLPSLGYRIDGVEIETERGPAETGRFTFTGATDRSVHDVLRDGRSASDDSRDDRREVAEWLIDYLTEQGGEAKAPDVFRAGQSQGHSRDALKRAKGSRVTSVKSGMGGGWVWRLNADEGSTKGAKSAAFLTPLPSLPSVLPSDEPAICEVCGFPMTTLGDGATTHPGCDGVAL